MPIRVIWVLERTQFQSSMEWSYKFEDKLRREIERNWKKIERNGQTYRYDDAASPFTVIQLLQLYFPSKIEHVCPATQLFALVRLLRVLKCVSVCLKLEGSSSSGFTIHFPTNKQHNN